MSVVNKRNALLGWLVWIVAKRSAKKKISGALPGDRGSRRRGVVIPALVAAALGGLLFWRNRQDGDDISE